MMSLETFCSSRTLKEYDRNIRITVVPKSFKYKYFSTRLHAQYESISESQNTPIHPGIRVNLVATGDAIEIEGVAAPRPRLRHRQTLNFPGDTDGK